MIKKVFVAVVAIATFSVAHAQSSPESSGADLIVFNAKIFTGTRAEATATALAVKDGRIYSVGPDATILALKGAATKVIDAHNRRLIPGIIDAHIHVLNDLAYNFNVRWDGVPTLRQALTMLREQAARTPDGQWVKVIGGWAPYQFKENRFPTLAELRNAVPNRPMIVQYAYNEAFLNKQAMTALGVGTSRFPQLPDVEIEKDARGNPTGVVHGYTWLFLALETMVPQPTFDEQVSSVSSSIHGLNRFGVTTIVDNGGRWAYPKGQQVVSALAREGHLNVRMPFVDLQLGAGGPVNMVDLEIEAITKTAPISPGQNLYPDLAHGLEYRGAGEVLNGDVHDHENFDRAAVIIAPEKMRRFVEEDVKKLIQHRIPFRMHISYNENISPFLDALEKVNETVPLDGLRWSLEHAETITPENMARVKKLGGGIALDGKMALHADSFIKRYGRDKALETPRLRMLMDSGIPLAMTSDAFRAATYNPWVNLSWMVTGKSVSGSEALATNNRLSRAEALQLYTRRAAWFADADSELGAIAPGNLADFALLDRDYFAVPDDEIKSVTSVLTVMNGRVVFGAQDYAGQSPTLPETLPSWSPVKYFGTYYGEK
ncbi:amidohydrolase [Sphingomonas sp. VNH70]|jgi:predicted amidohydrolase YtcJ|uniref:amidohydrolase n=1 Tax=Sphingomonas silueang TaxID=3156617 RepID=UPI0032B5FF1E